MVRMQHPKEGSHSQFVQAPVPRLSPSSPWAPVAACYHRIAAQAANAVIPNQAAMHGPPSELVQTNHLQEVPIGTRAARAACSLAIYRSDQNTLPRALAAVACSRPHGLLNPETRINGHCRGAASEASTPGIQVSKPAVAVTPSFPSASDGGVIMGRIEQIPAASLQEEARKIISSSVFDQEYQRIPDRTGRKQLGKALKGDYIADYYLDKITDPLNVNMEGAEQAVIRQERNERGFKRRKPQKKTPEAAMKAKKKKK